MIRLYSGTPGSGKSLHNARDVINRSRSGKPVIGNFPCDLKKYSKANYTYVPNSELTPEFLIQYSRNYFAGKKIKEGALLVVIDECQLMFNSRDWQQKGRDKWLSFFTQHRKYGFDVTLIAQFDRMIDRQIRGVIEYEYVHRKMSNYGIGGKIMSLLFGGNTFVVVQMWYPLKLKVGSEFIHAYKRLYSIYDTFGTFDADSSPSLSSSEKQNDEKTDTQQSHQPDGEPGSEVQKPEKRRFFKKVFSREKQSKEKKKNVGKYAASDQTSFKPSKLTYKAKFYRRFPENRTELGWRKHNVKV